MGYGDPQSYMAPPQLWEKNPLNPYSGYAQMSPQETARNVNTAYNSVVEGLLTSRLGFRNHIHNATLIRYCCLIRPNQL